MPIHAKRCLLAVQPDRRLVQLVAEGHERAFEAVVQRYRRPLLRYCARLGLEDGRREDALQHALLRAWLALARGTEVRELRPWLYRIVHNAAVDALRGPGEAHDALTEDTMPALSAREDETEARIAARETLADVAALPELQREAILMSAVDGRSHEEVASALGVSDGAVRGLLYRARSSLRAAAAAFTPQPLIGWASGYASRLLPSASRLAELSGPTAGAGAAVGLLKGAALATTTAVVVAGVVVHPHALSPHAPARSAAVGTLPTTGASAHPDSSAQALGRALAALDPSRVGRHPRRSAGRRGSPIVLLDAAPSDGHGFGGSRGEGGDSSSGAPRPGSHGESEGGDSRGGSELSKAASTSEDGSGGSGSSAVGGGSSDGSQGSPTSSGSGGAASSVSSDGAGSDGGGGGDTSTTPETSTTSSSGDGSSSSTSTSASGDGGGGSGASGGEPSS